MITSPIADFTAYAEKGSGYTLRVGKDVSHAFDIRDDLYAKMKYDALAFFYQQRSGIPIEMPYAGDPQWVRPAGHIGVKPNYGDNVVPCHASAGCKYTLDVSGGWYDAGDHGKYVVNAGISVWTLLNWWERGLAFGGTADFADGKMNIPENKNKVPDLLDEARWELEFELKMQVPEGEKLAGMAHHKIHDAKWTALSMGPHEDPVPRFLYPVSTSATLDLAANAAQAARIWRTIDRAFADKCLKAAERAWVAAKANPAALSPTVQDDGGGPYDDNKVDDNFYWAAAELYITTKKAEYKDVVVKSEFFKRVDADWSDDPGMQHVDDAGATRRRSARSRWRSFRTVSAKRRRRDPQERRRRRRRVHEPDRQGRATGCRSASRRRATRGGLTRSWRRTR